MQPRKHALAILFWLTVPTLGGTALLHGAERSTAGNFVIGTRFAEALDRPVALTMSNTSMRQALRKVSDDWEISVLLDRRVDPTVPRKIDLNAPSLRAGLAQMAGQADAEIRVIANTVVVAPGDKLKLLPTLVQLRNDELFSADSRIAAPRRLELVKPMQLTWEDLEKPRAVVERICRHYHLELGDGDRLPHDMWAGATLPSVDAAEALSLVLFQFDLAFNWMDGGNGIAIVPMPEKVSIERTYTLGPLTAAKTAEEWSKGNPGIEARAVGDKVVVRGTVEQHAAISGDKNGARNGRPNTRQDNEPIPLSRRLFTLTLRRIPARNLFKSLNEKGIDVQYDEDALKKAGVSLETPISLEVDKVRANEFFQAICDKLGVDFAIEGSTVRLVPR